MFAWLGDDPKPRCSESRARLRTLFSERCGCVVVSESAKTGAANGANVPDSLKVLAGSPDAVLCAVDALACEWASLPAVYGSRSHRASYNGTPSCYGQLVHSFADLYKVFYEAYQRY